MKIIQFVQRPQLRGAELFTAQLSEHLSERGHHVILVTLFQGEASLPFSGKQIHLKRPSALRLFDWGGLRAINRIIHEERPDIVQANAGDTLKYVVLSKIFFGWKAPLIFRNASMISLYVRSTIVKRLNAFLFKHVDMVISVSSASRADFLKLFGFQPDRVRVIPVGVNEVQVVSLKGGNAKYLLHVGGFTFEKNHTGLLRIFNRIQKLVDIQLWLVGNGPLRQEIEELVIKMGLQEKVRFLGFRTDVAELMHCSEGVLLPSIIEGLPAVILEAMLLGVPVVANDTGGISDVVINGKTGWLVPVGDEDRFSEAVLEILQSSEVSSITIAARQLVKGNFTNEKITDLFLAGYEEILKNSASRVG